MEQRYAAASSSKRGLNGPSSSAPPNKHSKSVEVEEAHDLHDPFYDDSDSEYQERIALNAINASLCTEIMSEADVDMDIANSAGFDDDVEYDSVSIGSNKSDDDRQVPYLSLSSHTDTTLQLIILLLVQIVRERSVENLQEWIVDSGAASHFTYNLNNFAEYEPMNDGPQINTASKDNPVQIKGKGTVFISHSVEGTNGSMEEHIM
ncbi:hypothetical protein PQX77_021524 [Marasmius sp. AFHP31]|nr:hypothetical protein PQX77_021524 [Marasmius sp. AFHP31]